MREQKNILNYGFLLALFLIGIISIFCENQVFVESINNLSIPIFLFTISTLLAKGNTYIRGRIFKSISTNKDLIDKYDNLLERYNVVIKKNQEWISGQRESLNNELWVRTVENVLKGYENRIK